MERRKLTEQEKVNIQRNLSNYLRSHRSKNDLAVKDLAGKLDYTPQAISMMESIDVPYTRIISSLEYLKQLSELEKISMGEFIRIMLGKKRKDAGLKDWEEQVLVFFGQIKHSALTNFLSFCPKLLQQGAKKIEACIELLCITINFTEEEVLNLCSLLSKRNK